MTSGVQWLAALVAACLCWLLCAVIVRVASRAELMDTPGERSSHRNPTPTSGGIAILGGLAVGVSLIGTADVTDAVLWAAALLCLVGLADDRWQLPIAVRLIMQMALSVSVLTDLQPDTTLPWLALQALALTGLINIFNFMDGLDGMAAQQAIFMSVVFGVLALTPESSIYLALAASVGGFLFWNRAPARLFMGDAGSLPLGFLLALPLVCAPVASGSTLPIAMIAWTLFVVDASVTLFNRLWRGESIHLAHREHIYQRLSQRWQEHGRVTTLYALLNISWSLPWLLLALAWPEHAVLVVLLCWGGAFTVAYWALNRLKMSIPSGNCN